jgi:hypothetical protein
MDMLTLDLEALALDTFEIGSSELSAEDDGVTPTYTRCC